MKLSYLVGVLIALILTVLSIPKFSRKIEIYNLLRKSVSGEIATNDSLRMKYRLALPSKKDDGKAPLLVILHHNGGQGSDNLKPIKSNADLVRVAKKHYHSYVLVPQCPPGKVWTINPETPFNNFNLDSIPVSPYLESVAKIIFQLVEKYDIDTRRIYIAGHSMGATGLWEIVMRNPQLFAAAVPVCGASDEKSVILCKNMSVWAFSAELDHLYDYHEAELVIDTLKKITQKEVKFTLEMGKGHGIWDKSTILNTNTLNWLYKQEK